MCGHVEAKFGTGKPAVALQIQIDRETAVQILRSGRGEENKVLKTLIEKICLGLETRRLVAER